MHHPSNIILVVGGIVFLMLVAAIVLALTKRIRLPFSVALVLVGIALGWLGESQPAFAWVGEAITLTPDLILFVFLPTLIFESAFNLDVRQLRQNLGPVLLLAVPGLLISTFLIGGIVAAATPIPFAESLILGAILSATDPVAVVSLFKKLGAPARLTVLVEGESLFNDATSIVVARLLVGILAAGAMTLDTFTSGVVEFFVVFIGGVAVGWVLAVVMGYIIGLVEADPYIEITLTTILAYLSFLVAEELLHVSGVMATVAAGLTLGSWGRMKISPTVRHYLEHFWEYMAFVANAFIFLLVGLSDRIRLDVFIEHATLLFWVVAAMLISRATVVYGLLPVAGMLPGREPISSAYRTVIYWGGLRGAIAIAIVLSLPDFEYADTFVVLVMGGVLFTLLVQGITMEPLVKFLGLDKPTLSDKLADAEARVAARRNALARLPDLRSGGMFSLPIVTTLESEYLGKLRYAEKNLERIREHEISVDKELQLLLLRQLSDEKALYIKLFNNGHLSESGYRRLCAEIAEEIDSLRHEGSLYVKQPGWLNRRSVETIALNLLSNLPLCDRIAERWRRERLVLDYEIAWAHHEAASHVLANLDAVIEAEKVPEVAVDGSREQFASWQRQALEELDTIAEQLPELVQAVQERLGRRLMLLAEEEAVEELCSHGAVPVSVAEHIKSELNANLRRLRAKNVVRIRFDKASLLRKLPFFTELGEEEFRDVLNVVRERTVEKGETVFREGDRDDSLFMIARGVVRVSKRIGDEIKDIATLIAGDFFGEMALLHQAPRSASIRAVSIGVLYELRRSDVMPLIERHTELQELLERTEQARINELDSNR